MTDNPASDSPNRHPELVSGSIPPITWNKRRQAQPHGQVPPLRVLGVDQVDLPLPMPVLELLFAQDRPLHVAEHLEVDEAVDLVSPCEPRKQSLTMLHQPLQQVRRDADVDRAVVPVRKEIDARVPLFAHALGNGERWTLKQVQGDEEGFGLELFPNPSQPHFQPQTRHAELVSASIMPHALPPVTG